MRRRFIVTSSIAIIVFAMCLIGINVYAKMNQSFSVQNTIGFVPSNNIYVALDCKVSGCKQANLTTVPQGSPYSTLDEYRNGIGISHKVEFDESIRGQDQGLANPSNAWNITESLEFVNGETPIVYEIVVYNYSMIPISVQIEFENKTGENIVNVATKIDRLEGYIPGVAPNSATIRLTSTVKDNARGFDDEPNNFKVIFSQIEE